MRYLLTPLLIVATLGCEEESSGIRQITERQDLLTQRPEPKVDLLWIIDNSNTMSGEQQKLAEQISVFFAGLLGRTLDYHVGVITTDPAEGGKLRRYKGPGVPGCESCAFVTRATPCEDPRVTGTADQIRAKCPALAVFRELTQVGVDGSAAERAFEQAGRALGLDVEDASTGLPVVDPATGRVLSMPPVENMGFLREDADLMLIFVSDEDEGLKGVGSPVRYYERLFSLVKARTERRVIVSAFVGWPIKTQGALMHTPDVDAVCERYGPLFDGSPSNDGDLRRELDEITKDSDGCLDMRAPNARDSFAETGLRYIELTCRAGGTVANICAPDYQKTFERLTETALALGRSFELSSASDLDRGPDCVSFTADDPRLDCDGNQSTEDAVDGPICVRATPENGAEMLVPRDAMTGWQWDDAASAIAFRGTFVPAPASPVSIRYRVGLGMCQ